MKNESAEAFQPTLDMVMFQNLRKAGVPFHEARRTITRISVVDAISRAETLEDLKSILTYMAENKEKY